MTNASLSTDPKRTLAVLSGPGLSIMLAAYGVSSAAVTLPDVSFAFGGQSPNPALVVSMYILAVTALIVPVGRAGDLYGKRSVLASGLCLFSLGAVLAFLAPTLTALIASRFVQGAGAAAMMAMPLAMVRDLVSSGEIGRWMGVLGTMSAIGTASGPAIGAAAAAAFGWRSVYLLQVPFALATLVLCLLWIRGSAGQAEKGSVDLPGAGALAAFLTALTFLMSELVNGFDVTDGLLAALAIGALMALYVIETRSFSPIIPLDLLRSSRLRISLAMNVIVSLVMMGMLVVGPFFLMDGLGLTTAQMGLAMSVGPISSALSGIPAGRFTEKVGTGYAVTAGASAMAFACAAMATLPYLLGLGGFILAFILLAPSYQVFLAALNTSVMERASEQDRGVTSGILNLSRNFGFILGAGSVSAVFWSLAYFESGIEGRTPIVSFAMAGTFAMCSLLILCVVLLSVLSHRNNVTRQGTGHS